MVSYGTKEEYKNWKCCCLYWLLEENLDLNQCISGFWRSRIYQRKIPGVVYRTTSPETASLIFGSGKRIVCTGAKSIADVDIGLSKVFEKLEKWAPRSWDRLKLRYRISLHLHILEECSTSCSCYRSWLEKILNMNLNLPRSCFTGFKPQVVLLLSALGTCDNRR